MESRICKPGRFQKKPTKNDSARHGEDLVGLYKRLKLEESSKKIRMPQEHKKGLKVLEQGGEA